MTTEEKDWFLGLPAEIKLELLGDMLKEGNAGMALATAKILLDAPFSEGGILTEDINKVFDNNLNQNKEDEQGN